MANEHTSPTRSQPVGAARRRRASAAPDRGTAPRDPRAQPEWSDAIPRRLLAVLEANPQLMEDFLGLCSGLMAHVAPRLREFAALRTSAELDAEYPWAGHRVFALLADISHDEIAAIAADAGEEFELVDAAVMQGVNELLRDGRLSPATRLALGPATVVSLVIAAGTYQTIGWLMDGIGAEPGLDGAASLATPDVARTTYAALREQRISDERKSA